MIQTPFQRVNNSSKQNPRRIQGQGLTEYIIIVALIAIASIVAVSYFGSSVKASFLAMGSELVGGENVDTVQVTQANYNAANSAAKNQTTLKNYRD